MVAAQPLSEIGMVAAHGRDTACLCRLETCQRGRPQGWGRPCQRQGQGGRRCQRQGQGGRPSCHPSSPHLTLVLHSGDRVCMWGEPARRRRVGWGGGHGSKGMTTWSGMKGAELLGKDNDEAGRRPTSMSPQPTVPEQATCNSV